MKRPKKLDANGLWDYALRALAARPHSTAELRTKLARRSESPDLLPPLLDKLREYGFADDQKFSDAYASARLQNQGFGRARVLRDLRAKRVAGTVASESVEKAFAGTDERELIDQFIQRRFRGKDLPVWLKEEKNAASAYRRLRTAGFSNSASIAALKRYRTDLPEWEETPDEIES